MSDSMPPPDPTSSADTVRIPRPPTSELKAFSGMPCEPGCRPRTRQVHDQLMAAITSEPINCIESTPDMLDVCANAAKSMEAWHLELIRLIQAGLTREQLVALIQWSAIQWTKEHMELRSLAADDRAEAKRKANPYFRLGVELSEIAGMDEIRDRINETYEYMRPDGE